MLFKIGMLKSFANFIGSGTLLLVEDETSSHGSETRTIYFKKETHCLIDQPSKCHIFMLGCIKSIFFK